MKVDRIQNQQSFGAFKVKDLGATYLAVDFIENPKIEKLFMKKIVAPLEKAGKDVIFDGKRVLFKNENNITTTIIDSTPKHYTTMPLAGPLAYSRSVYRPLDRSKMKYTNDFENLDTCIYYPDIEAAKNIVLNMSAERSGKAIEAYEEAAKNFKIPDTGDNFADKTEKLQELFG